MYNISQAVLIKSFLQWGWSGWGQGHIHCSIMPDEALTFYFFQGGVCGSRKARWIRCYLPGRFYKIQTDFWLNAMCWLKNGGRKTFHLPAWRVLNHLTVPNYDFYGKVICTVLVCCHSNNIALAERLHSVISYDFSKRSFNFLANYFLSALLEMKCFRKSFE